MSIDPGTAVSNVWQHLQVVPKIQEAQASANAKNAVSNLDLTSPQAYMMSAMDLARYNTQSSQALAREQMAFQERANAKAMDFSASEAQKVRDWQTMMSDTAHQREVKDLLAAGLNPILSANQGAAVGSSPAGQGVTSSGAKGTVDLSAMSALVNMWTQAKQVEMQDKSLELQAALNVLNNETNRYMADKSAAASIYGSGAMASANRYAAMLAKQASEYAADLNYNTWSEGYHSEFGQLVNLFSEWLNPSGSDGSGKSAGSKGIFQTFLEQLGQKTLFPQTKGQPVESRGGGRAW